MKGRIFDKIGYNFIEGKGLLIVVVVLFSSVSFIMGFFAGKKVSSSAVLQAKNIGIIEAKAVRPAMPTPTAPAPPLPTAPPTQPAPATLKPQEVKPQEEPPAGRKTYDVVSPVEQPSHSEPVRPESALPEQPKAEKPKPAAPTAEPIVIPNTVSQVQPKAKIPKTAKHIPEAQPQTETKTPQPTPEHTKPTPPVKDILTPVSPPPQGSQAAQGTFHASKTTVQQQKIANKEVTASKSGEKYYIQIGAFKNAGDATRLQEDLKTKGFDSEIVKNPVNDGVTLFKVRVGSNYTKSEASQVMARLNKKGIKGFMRDNQRTP
ncbi:MAG: SPOR domain-containing protein [Nitrospirae bacterium]|nr:SPOR domain-containing protein [Nitrospirota bacterium]